MFIELSAPINIQWELTPWCNHNCVHCYNYWRTHATLEGSSLIMKSDVLSAVEEEVEKNKIFHITLTGGEPLAVIEKNANTLKIFRKRGITLGLNSNLTLLTASHISLLKELGISSVLTSLMSFNPDVNDAIVQRKGAFKRIIGKIELAVQNGLNVSVNMVVTKQNFHTIAGTGKLVKELGAVAFCATKACTPGNCSDFSGFEIDQQQLIEMFKTLLFVRDTYEIKVDSLEHYPACIFPDEETMLVFGSRGCTAGKTCCTIGFDGGMRPCSHAPMTYGNIADGLDIAWKAMSIWRKGTLVPTSCQKICGAYPFRCGGGCRVEAYTHGKTLGGLDPHCTGRKPVIAIVEKKHTNTPNGQYKVAEAIRFRTENFGAIVFHDQRNWLAIDHKLYQLLLKAGQSEKEINLLSISKEYGVGESEVKDTLAKLIAKRILVPISKGKEVINDGDGHCRVEAELAKKRA